MEKNVLKQLNLSGTISPNAFEECAEAHGVSICGIDEAGRGSLGGPLVAAAVILIPGIEKSPLLKDSKRLSPLKRDQARSWLETHSWYGVGLVSARQVDEWGLTRANLYAMERAFAQLIASTPRLPALVLVDAMRPDLSWWTIPKIPNSNLAHHHRHPLEHFLYTQLCFPFAEDFSASVAAASIIAKTSRDRIITTVEAPFTNYAFAQHKGYGTALHKAKLYEDGLSILHRKSFCSFLKQSLLGKV